MPDPKRTCSDCGVELGQFHDRACLKERCPFCGGHVPLCDCIFSQLDLNPEEREVVEEFIDDLEEPLFSIMQRWRAKLDDKGRIPFGKES